MLVNKYKFFYCVVTMLFSIFFSTVSITTENGFYWIAVAATVELIFFLWANWKITDEIVSYSIFFVVLLYIFHFGQIILLGLFPAATYNQQITLDYFNESECIAAMKIINMCFAVCCISIIIFSKSNSFEEISNNKSSDKNNSLEWYQKKALLMIGLTFPIKFFIDLIFLIIAISQGEKIGVIWLASFPNFITAYGNLSIIGFCLLIISLKYDTRKQIRVLAIIMIYFLLLMLSGRRSENVVYICILAFFFIKTYNKKMNGLKVAAIIILAYLFLNFLFTIVYSRTQVGSQDIFSFADSFKEVLKERNIFVEALREYGNTGYTAVCVPTFWLKKYLPTYGISLVESCMAILPNIGGLPGRITELGNFAVQLQKTQMLSKLYTNIGGSIIGELLFNFGNIGGVISFIVVGFIIARINNRSRQLLRNHQFLKLAYYIPGMVAMLYWIRDVFGGGIRTVVWGCLFVYIANKIVVERHHEENINSNR